ncbi:MAG: hypothetical protein ACE37E_05125 [Hyphomicrobiales bacterium]
MPDKNIVVENQVGDEDEINVSLPVKRQEFADFIGSIIGGKDRLRKEYYSSLLVNRALLVAIESAIQERLQSQNEGSIVSKRYSIKLSSGRGLNSDNLNSIFSLSPSLNDNSKSFAVEYVFVIVYPGMNSPARETINLSFSKSDDAVRAELSIEYVNRHWAEDMLNTVDSILINSNIGDKKAIYIQNPSYIGSNSFKGMLVLAGISIYIFGVFYYEAAVRLPEDLSSLTVEGQIEYLIEITRPHINAIYNVVFLIIALLLVFLPIMILDPPSIVSDKHRIIFDIYDSDKKKIEEIYLRKKRYRITSIITFIGAIIASAVGSALFNWIVSL